MKIDKNDSGVIRIPMPKPKQRGWTFLGIQGKGEGKELVYIRRRWTKSPYHKKKKNEFSKIS